MLEVKYTCDHCKKEFNLPIHGFWAYQDERTREPICKIEVPNKAGMHNIKSQTVCNECYMLFNKMEKEAYEELYERWKNDEPN